MNPFDLRNHLQHILAMENILGQVFRADIQIKVRRHPSAQSILLR
jgi:hypothetical protein